MAWFSLRRQSAAKTAAAFQAIALADLGADLIALRLGAGDLAPPGTVVVVFDAAGRARRAEGGKLACAPDDTAFCFHPGPYTVDLAPFAAAPEWGLRLRFVIDAASPHVDQQRFDLYLYAEAAPGDGRLALAGWAAAVQAALQAELAHGALDLPPCTSLEEWHAFRAGLNQLLYTRFGVTVEDCIPVDLGGQVDFARVLQARARQAAIVQQAVAAERTAAAGPVLELHSMSAVPATAAPPELAMPATVDATVDVTVDATAGAARERTPVQATVADADAAGLRRLFLELPAVGRDLRVLALPPGPAAFRQHQDLLLRLGMASLNVDTMPSLAWTAPDQPLAASQQARRASATAIAVAALDGTWSLLARLQLAGADDWPALLDDADRICANLETGLALRRAPHGEPREPSL